MDGRPGHGENQIDEMHELSMCIEIRLRHEPVKHFM